MSQCRLIASELSGSDLVLLVSTGGLDYKSIIRKTKQKNLIILKKVTHFYCRQLIEFIVHMVYFATKLEVKLRANWLSSFLRISCVSIEQNVLDNHGK